MEPTQQQAIDKLKESSPADLTTSFLEVVKGRPIAEQKDVAQKLTAAAVNGIQSPKQETSDMLWTIVVSAFRSSSSALFWPWLLECSRPLGRKE